MSLFDGHYVIVFIIHAMGSKTLSLIRLFDDHCYSTSV